jgi:hypothetical protein
MIIANSQTSLKRYFNRKIWIIHQLREIDTAPAGQPGYVITFKTNRFSIKRFSLFLGSEISSSNPILRICRQRKILILEDIRCVRDINVKGDLGSICVSCRDQEHNRSSMMEMKFLIHSSDHRSAFLKMHEMIKTIH